ncbi:MAG: uracil phosphoribosyltransferase [Microgenomates group bacterium]|nr:uracil phosphoribosyltransferase [Microgenomates group bacterium]
MKNVYIVKHSLIQDFLSHLRNRKTSLHKFRHYSDRICQLLFFEAIRDLQLQKITLETPLSKTGGVKISDEIIILPVLRAGIAMLFGALYLLPKSKIGFIGLERDEKTAKASQYYWKMPLVTEKSVVIITDPMLATGGSLVHVLRQVAPKNPKRIIVVCVVAATEGIKMVQKEFPRVKIFTAVVDKKLNVTKYIVPGLGDYGDRYFGT